MAAKYPMWPPVPVCDDGLVIPIARDSWRPYHADTAFSKVSNELVNSGTTSG